MSARPMVARALRADAQAYRIEAARLHDAAKGFGARGDAAKCAGLIAHAVGLRMRAQRAEAAALRADLTFEG